MDDIAAPLKEILENRRTILNKCNELYKETSTQCSCNATLEMAQKEMKGLQTTCTALENTTREHTNAMREIQNTIKDVKDKIKALQRKHCREVTVKQTYKSVISSDSDAHVEHNKELIGHSARLELIPTRNQETKPAESNSKSQPKYSVYHVTSSTSDARSTVKHDRNDKEQTEACVDKVVTVKQEVKIIPFGEAHWRHVSQNELEESRTLFCDLDGVHSVLCLDISESMLRYNGWEQASTFVKEYLQGLKEIHRTRDVTDEYVALVTFGHETVVKQRYTNNYDALLQVFNNLQLGGPSPLFGGMLMSLAAAWCSRHQTIQVGCGTPVGTRIIIISDGRPTDTGIIAGPDRDSSLDTEETNTLILGEMDHYKNANFDVFFVPVGNSHSSFFELVLGFADGVMLDHKSGRRFARRHFLSTKIVDVMGSLPFPSHLMPPVFGEEMSEEDEADMKSIQKRAQRYLYGMDRRHRQREDYYHERQRSTLPAVGSRVRRGPDWKWHHQDSSGPGTVIGHHQNTDQVYVEWDIDKHQNIYRYGDIGYDVIIVDEPRKVSDKHSLDVGCNVKPGEKWKVTDPKHKSGIVLKLDKTHKKATVRWDNGRKGQYSYDSPMEEIVYSPPLQTFSSEGYSLGYTEDNSRDNSTGTHRRNKNKNVSPK